MSKTTSRPVPRYRHHKPSGQAVVTMDGRDFYLGSWNGADSRREYDKLTGDCRRLPRTLRWWNTSSTL